MLIVVEAFSAFMAKTSPAVLSAAITATQTHTIVMEPAKLGTKISSGNTATATQANISGKAPYEVTSENAEGLKEFAAVIAELAEKTGAAEPAPGVGYTGTV